MKDALVRNDFNTKNALYVLKKLFILICKYYCDTCIYEMEVSKNKETNTKLYIKNIGQ